MPVKRTDDGLIFSTGKGIYTNCGFVGICPKGEDGVWWMSEGYDGYIDHEELTDEEKKELADYMIGLWQQFKNET